MLYLAVVILLYFRPFFLVNDHSYAAFTIPRYNIVKFDVKENVMTISAKSEVGNVNENVNINLEVKDMAIAFNGKYILDFLKITDNEFINLNLNSPIDPCVMTSVIDDGFLYLVLPVRINS